MSTLHLKNNDWAIVANEFHFKELLRDYIGDDVAYWFQKEVIDQKVRLKEDLKWLLDMCLAKDEWSDLKDFIEDFINN